MFDQTRSAIPPAPARIFANSTFAAPALTRSRQFKIRAKKENLLAQAVYFRERDQSEHAKNQAQNRNGIHQSTSHYFYRCHLLSC
jgi:hypothetical protein